ncbi:hypothetical protein F5Y06DRAFT_186306 [Hypoxylon sp. FL0890]|nr:hypothetical protein F5Y06DRAFT_186306 [Hypoxylon sp. FL0890]
MPHATKKASCSRLAAPVSASVQYPQTRTQSSQPSSASSSSAYSYSWTATDAANASRDGAFLTPWPRNESYYAPPVQLLGQGYQSSQGQGQGQSQESQKTQYYRESTHKPSTAPAQGGSGGAK